MGIGERHLQQVSEPSQGIGNGQGCVFQGALPVGAEQFVIRNGMTQFQFADNAGVDYLAFIQQRKPFLDVAVIEPVPGIQYGPQAAISRGTVQAAETKGVVGLKTGAGSRIGFEGRAWWPSRPLPHPG